VITEPDFIPGIERAPKQHGDGFRIVHLAARPSVVIIRHWSDDLEGALEGLSLFAARFEAGAADAGGCLGRMARFADGLVALTVPRTAGRDLAAANELGKLEELAIDGGAKGLDLGSFPLLRKLEVQRAADLSALSLLPALEELSLDAPRVDTLRTLAGARGLRKLTVNPTGRLRSLDGIEGLPIEVVKVEGRPLESVGAVAALPALRELQLDGIRKVTDIERIGGAGSLERLTLSNGPVLPSFDFVAGLRKLREFGVSGTEVAADPLSITPFLGLPELQRLWLHSGLRNAADLVRLGEIPTLTSLSLGKAPDLPSLDFLRSLTALESLYMDGLRVADGDLGPLLALPKLVRWRIYPHPARYSHTEGQLELAIHARRPEVLEQLHAHRRELGIPVDPDQWRRRRPARPPAPGEVLSDVPWRFDEDVRTRAELVETMAEAMQDRGASWEPDQVVLPVGRIRVAVPIRRGKTVELASSDGAPFTAAELLWALHRAVAPMVGGTDYLYFEGLRRAGDVYELRLGS
jgi:hypothetical protein